MIWKQILSIHTLCEGYGPPPKKVHPTYYCNAHLTLFNTSGYSLASPLLRAFLEHISAVNKYLLDGMF